MNYSFILSLSLKDTNSALQQRLCHLIQLLFLIEFI